MCALSSWRSLKLKSLRDLRRLTVIVLRALYWVTNVAYGFVRIADLPAAMSTDDIQAGISLVEKMLVRWAETTTVSPGEDIEMGDDDLKDGETLKHRLSEFLPELQANRWASEALGIL